MASVLVAMSGGVDSSVAAALLAEAGHEVTGVTMKLWGGASDSGCCSVSDVDDARRVADALGIEHHVFNFGDDFTRHVVDPYVAAHARGATPNPCIECNRHLKFDKLVRWADALGFDELATGHHARIVTRPGGGHRVARAVDTAKDQSYVVHMLDQAVLGRLHLPIGELTKAEVRAHAARLGLRTATKPDSQDVCFITAAHGRRAFLADRLPLTPGRVVDVEGAEVGAVDAVELVTIGQRKGLGLGGRADPAYVVAVDPGAATVTIGTRRDLLVDETPVGAWQWADGHRPDDPGPWLVQSSAHGRPEPADVLDHAVRWHRPHRRVAPGQTLVVYAADEVIAGALAG